MGARTPVLRPAPTQGKGALSRGGGGGPRPRSPLSPGPPLDSSPSAVSLSAKETLPQLCVFGGVGGSVSVKGRTVFSSSKRGRGWDRESEERVQGAIFHIQAASWRRESRGTGRATSKQREWHPVSRRAEQGRCEDKRRKRGRGREELRRKRRKEQGREKKSVQGKQAEGDKGEEGGGGGESAKGRGGEERKKSPSQNGIKQRARRGGDGAP